MVQPDFVVQEIHQITKNGEDYLQIEGSFDGRNVVNFSLSTKSLPREIEAIYDVSLQRLKTETASESPRLSNLLVKQLLHSNAVEEAQQLFSEDNEILFHTEDLLGMNQDVLLELVKLSLRDDPHQDLLSRIPNLKKLNEETRIEIAKYDSYQISSRIQEYDISDQTALIEIALAAAKQNGRETSRYIRNYGIRDPTALKDIALAAAKQNGEETSRFIRNYGITDPTTL